MRSTTKRLQPDSPRAATGQTAGAPRPRLTPPFAHTGQTRAGLSRPRGELRFPARLLFTELYFAPRDGQHLPGWLMAGGRPHRGAPTLAGLQRFSRLLLRITGLLPPPNPRRQGRAQVHLEPLLDFSRVGANVRGRF